jgi:hypothetical protein
MKAFIKDFETGEFGEFCITADMNTTKGNETTFDVDPTEVYPEMVTKCNMGVSTKVTVLDGDFIFEDELLEKIISDIETEAKHIKEASDNIAKEESDSRLEDHLLMIDSRVELINKHIQKFRKILDTIYGS